MKEQLTIGVLGAGHLGKIHLRLLNESDRYTLVGFYDPDREASQALVETTGYTYFESQEALLAACEVVDIVTPTLFHHSIAKSCIEKGKHIFIEKPITQTVEEAEELVALASAKELKGRSAM